MKSNEKYVFSLIYYLRRCLAAEAQNFILTCQETGSRDYFDVIYSTCRLVYNMDEWRICRNAEFNTIFLRLRWKLKDFDQMAGWGPV